MELRTKLHTIFMMIGSTECGKTTFAKEILIPQLQFADATRNFKANIQYLSSDGIRQELLGAEQDKYDQTMLEASQQAFQLLFEKLKLVTTFPINAEFIIVDTTGLSDDFRKQVRNIAIENNYNLEVILFDYRKREDYFSSERSKRLITDHLNRLRKEVLGSLAGEKYEKIHKVRSKDFFDIPTGTPNPAYQVVIENQQEYLATILSHDHEYFVIGDVHECVDELQDLLQSYGYQLDGNQLIATKKVENTKIILAGDWIDKGKKTKEIIEFLTTNQEHFLFVIGNHESFVYKFMRDEVKGIDRDLLHDFFDSTQVLKNDAQLLQKFNQLFELAQPFYRFIGLENSSYYITHAPCKNKYIGKLDSNSTRHQRNYRINREAPLEEQLTFLKAEAVGNHPYHLFGHIAAQNAFRIKNKLHLDTGCVLGNQLTGVNISYKPFYKSRKSHNAALEEELIPLFQKKQQVSLSDLEQNDLKKLKFCAENQINFISGTMSPADKDEAAGELESLAQGLLYFKNNDVKEVLLQPKYMGSRCNIYLYLEVEKCFAVSRNGYKIHQVDLSEVYQTLLQRFSPFMKENQVDMMLLDGELLPWRALGEGLIDRQFMPIEAALQTELDFLRKHNFEGAFNSLVENYQSTDFEKDQHQTAKTELLEKYGSSSYQNYKNLATILKSRAPLTVHDVAFKVYQKQLEYYGQTAELEYKPFAILKCIKQNREEYFINWTQSTMYRFLSDDDFLQLNLDTADYLERATAFFAKLTVENHMEGVVIKPDDLSSNSVPFMKVRNSEYMSIIYGYDYQFPHKYNKLIKQKSIQKKLRTSINEWKLGKAMLDIKMDDISAENKQYQQIVANMLFETAKEREIDPRL